MKACSRRFLAGFVAALALNPAWVGAQDKPVGDRLRVVASFSILGDMVREIGRERVNLTTLVGPDGDAHVYTATPADAKAVGEAGLIVVNGLKFEGWIDRLVKASGTRGMLATATKGIKPLEVKEANDSHGHNHAGKADPHAWQDVANAKLYAANIRDGLIAADTTGRAVYEANAAAYLLKLDALDAEIRATLARIPQADRKVITSHDAFGYFAKAYGMRFIAPKGVSTEAEASARDVAAVIRQARAEKVKAIFVENITNPKLTEQISRESGAKVGGRIYSDALSAPSGPAGTYIEMMRHNIRTMSEALGAGPA